MIIIAAVIIGATAIVVVVGIIVCIVWKKTSSSNGKAIEMGELKTNPDPAYDEPLYDEGLYNEPMDSESPYADLTNDSAYDPVYDDLEMSDSVSRVSQNVVTEYRNVVQVVTFDRDVQIYRQVDKAAKSEDDD